MREETNECSETNRFITYAGSNMHVCAKNDQEPHLIQGGCPVPHPAIHYVLVVHHRQPRLQQVLPTRRRVDEPQASVYGHGAAQPLDVHASSPIPRRIGLARLRARAGMLYASVRLGQLAVLALKNGSAVP